MKNSGFEGFKGALRGPRLVYRVPYFGIKSGFNVGIKPDIRSLKTLKCLKYLKYLKFLNIQGVLLGGSGDLGPQGTQFGGVA